MTLRLGKIVPKKVVNWFNNGLTERVSALPR